MELLKAYDSHKSSSEGSESLCEELGKNDVRNVYLLAYSKANVDLFPTREEFASAVILKAYDSHKSSPEGSET